MSDRPGTAPNFKNASIFMFGVNLIWIMFTIWAIWGFIAVAATAWCVNRAITFIEARQT